MKNGNSAKDFVNYGGREINVMTLFLNLYMYFQCMHKKTSMKSVKKADSVIRSGSEELKTLSLVFSVSQRTENISPP